MEDDRIRGGDCVIKMKEHDGARVKWREQIDRGWLDLQAGRVVEGPKAIADARQRLKSGGKKQVWNCGISSPRPRRSTSLPAAHSLPRSACDAALRVYDALEECFA